MATRPFHEVFVDAMHRHGYNQSTLADASGVSLDVVHRLCKGTRGTSVGNAIRLARILGLDIELFDRAKSAPGGPRRPGAASPRGSAVRRVA